MLRARSENQNSSPLWKSSDAKITIYFVDKAASTENKVAFARQLYNDVATQFNTKQAQFPTNLVRGLAGATPAELWQIDNDAERAVPKIDLSGRPSAPPA